MKEHPQYGIFTNGIPFVKFGYGSKTMLVYLGGPGNELPKGMAFNVYSKGIQPFVDTYTVYLLTRKSGLSENYSTKNMADDYAEMIQTEFNGKVDVIISLSYGSMIAQHFLADYPDLFRHFILAMSAHKMTELGKTIDLLYAKYLSEGNDRAALITIAQVLVPVGKRAIFQKIFFWLFGGLIKIERSSPTYDQDILIEAKAEVNHDATAKLKNIRVPILILSGDRDIYHLKSDVEEMAKLIPNSQLILYSGKGHLIMGRKQFAIDIMQFLSRQNVER
jgi:pimeloyl-ACP methyl ester carboxylesterase